MIDGESSIEMINEVRTAVFGVTADPKENARRLMSARPRKDLTPGTRPMTAYIDDLEKAMRRHMAAKKIRLAIERKYLDVAYMMRIEALIADLEI
jgi:hypothetical protein